MSRFDSRIEAMFPRASRSATHRVDTVILEPLAQVCRSSPAHCPSLANCSLIIWNGSGNSVRSKSWLTRPSASSRVKPYISDAPRFQNVIRSAASLTKMASVVKSSSRACSRGRPLRFCDVRASFTCPMVLQPVLKWKVNCR
jgi:hypothetical protein